MDSLCRFIVCSPVCALRFGPIPAQPDVWSPTRMLVKPNGEQLATIAGLIDAGKVPTPTVTELSLFHIKKAHEQSEGGRVQGKLVLTL